MSRKYTEKEIKDKIFELENGKYEMIGEYTNVSTPFLMRYHISQDEFVDYYTTASKFITCGYRYYKRKPKTEWNTDLVKEKIREMYGDEYSLLNEYINDKTKLKLKHNSSKCPDNEFEVRWGHFYHDKTKCPRCTQRKTHEYFIEEIYNLVSDEYTILSEYMDAQTKVLIRHNCEKCNNNEFYMTPNSFTTGYRCPECNRLRKQYTTEEVKEEIYKISSGEYIMVSTEYEGHEKEIILLHTTCGKEFSTTRKRFVWSKCRCPHCSKSAGENLLSEFFAREKIKYIPQMTFDGLVGDGGRKLSYDFYIPDYNLLIEYQGHQHYKPIELFGGKVQFEKQIRYDDIKRSYAKNNKIDLLEIPYWEKYNVEKILLEKIKQEVIEWKTS